MKTLRLRADPADPASPRCADLVRAAAILREGGTVAFATETVYGLGANALDGDAVAKVFAAKQRPSWDPLIVHLAGLSDLPQVAGELPPAARAWAARFWPGPLTVLVPRAPALPAAVTAGRDKVGVRVPAHPVALALLRMAGVPVAAPSANTFGHVSPTSADHVAADLDGRIDAILDSGPTLHGVESTVVDADANPCILYRPGAITLEQLRGVWPAVQAYAEPPSEHPQGQAADADPALAALPSPGLGMRHYAPRARLVLVDAEGHAPSLEHLAARLAQQLRAEPAQSSRSGLMLPSDIAQALGDALPCSAVRYAWGTWSEPATLAHGLYAGLRALDEQGVACIICPLPQGAGLGAAIRDRLLKAARRQ